MRVESFGKTKSGQEAHLYVLENEFMSVSISDFGATIVDMVVRDVENPNYPDRSIVLGYDDVSAYESCGGQLGASIGPVANRIANASYIWQGETHQLEANNGPNLLHSGVANLGKKLWSFVEDTADLPIYVDMGDLVLSVSLKGEDNPFPGNLVAYLVASLDGRNLKMNYLYQTSEDSFVNFTNHAYFNLNGKGLIHNHQVKLNANEYHPFKEHQIPEIEAKSVEGTAFDFTDYRHMGTQLSNYAAELEAYHGYDHDFVVNQAKKSAGDLYENARIMADGLLLTIASDAPHFQLYTGNCLDAAGRGGEQYERQSGLCIEPQFIPNDVNTFEASHTKANTWYKRTISYLVSDKDDEYSFRHPSDRNYIQRGLNNFEYYNPTKIVFGENCVADKLASEVAKLGKKVLLTYGGGSIKRNGIYRTVERALAEAGIEVVELSGIMSNPRIEKVREGIALIKEHNIDFVLAVGGGSVIDCSKFIAGGVTLPEGVDPWQYYFIEKNFATTAIPLAVVLTMSATGSEMNSGGVITNWETNQKLSGYGPALFPTVSFLDPTYTYSLPKHQVVYGVIDMLSHLMEQYFSSPDEVNITDEIIETIFLNIVKNMDVAKDTPYNYAARANIMWDATMALNRQLTCGKRADWMTHMMEHALSAFHDIPHGAGLAIVHPMYLLYVLDQSIEEGTMAAQLRIKKMARFAKRVWGVEDKGTSAAIAREGILRLRHYFQSLGAPITLEEVGIKESELYKIAASSVRFPTSYSNLDTEGIYDIYRSALRLEDK